MSKSVRVTVGRIPKQSSMGIRVDADMKTFFDTASAILDVPAAQLMRPGLRTAQRELIRKEPRLKRELQRINPALLNGLK